MPEEIRFFFRIGLFVVPIGVVYWFMSYDHTGTVLLGGLAAALALLISIALKLARGGRPPVSGPGGPLKRYARALGRLVGLEEYGAPEEPPLETEEEAIPSASLWPPVIALAAVAAGLGLVYGGWFYLPGALLAGAGTWGWVTQLRPRS